MISLLLGAVFSLVALPADDVGLIEVDRYPPMVWPERALCVSEELWAGAPEFVESLWIAERVWGVEWDVLVGSDSEKCIHVSFVGEDDWPSGPEVGLTLFDRTDGQPFAMIFRASYWNDCPGARPGMVLHEMGHAVGFRAHAWQGIMRPTLTCAGDDARLWVSENEREFARRTRKGIL